MNGFFNRICSQFFSGRTNFSFFFDRSSCRQCTRMVEVASRCFEAFSLETGFWWSFKILLQFLRTSTTVCPIGVSQLCTSFSTKSQTDRSMVFSCDARLSRSASSLHPNGEKLFLRFILTPSFRNSAAKVSSSLMPFTGTLCNLVPNEISRIL